MNYGQSDARRGGDLRTPCCRHATLPRFRFRTASTVRQADRICVLEHGKVVELGTHDELMAAGGRYHTMFELQASRFGDEEGVALNASA